MITPIAALLACALIVVGGLGAPSAAAQSIYRCGIGGKTTYSDRPCASGAMKTINTGGQPPAEQLAAARARLELAREMDAARRAQTAAERLSPVGGTGKKAEEECAQAVDLSVAPTCRQLCPATNRAQSGLDDARVVGALRTQPSPG